MRHLQNGVVAAVAAAEHHGGHEHTLGQTAREGVALCPAVYVEADGFAVKVHLRRYLVACAPVVLYVRG